MADEVLRRIEWFAFGTAGDTRSGPLCVIVVTDERLLVLHFLRKQEEIRRRIRHGEHPENVAADMSQLTYTRHETRLSRIDRISWRDGSHALRIHHHSETGDSKLIRGELNTERDREQLVQTVGRLTGRQADKFLNPAGVVESAWSYIVGLIFVPVAWASIVLTWDPVFLRGVRNGAIVLWLGIPGCTVAAILAELAVLQQLRKTTTPWPIRQTWQF